MLIGGLGKHGLTVLATFVFAFMAFAVLPVAANAHGKAGLMLISAENAATIVIGPLEEPARASPHCHSSLGQDCSTLIAFLMTSGNLAKTAGFDVLSPVYNALRTGWLLPFDPPPPRVFSRD